MCYPNSCLKNYFTSTLQGLEESTDIFAKTLLQILPNIHVTIFL